MDGLSAEEEGIKKKWQVVVRQLQCSCERVTEQSCAATDVSTRDKVTAATGVGSKEKEEAKEEEEARR